jgi:hypothetical protein
MKADISLEDRYMGVLLGLACGDAAVGQECEAELTWQTLIRYCPGLVRPNTQRGARWS